MVRLARPRPFIIPKFDFQPDLAPHSLWRPSLTGGWSWTTVPRGVATQTRVLRLQDALANIRRLSLCAVRHAG